jgi:hypothetical protein
LYDGVAFRAGELRAHVPDHPEARRNVFEWLTDLLPQAFEFAATRWTAFDFWQILDAFAGQMRGQGRAMAWRGDFGAPPFQFFQRQFKRADHPLRTLSKRQAAQLGDDKLQRLDLGFTGGQFRLVPTDMALLLKHLRLQDMEFIG